LYKVVDGYNDEMYIAQLFAHNYRRVYSSVPFDTAEMHNILAELDARVAVDGLNMIDYIFTRKVIMSAIIRLNLHKIVAPEDCLLITFTGWA
jgi:hypothetical protein